jgi:hypothetical protein
MRENLRITWERSKMHQNLLLEPKYFAKFRMQIYPLAGRALGRQAAGLPGRDELVFACEK